MSWFNQFHCTVKNQNQETTVNEPTFSTSVTKAGKFAAVRVSAHCKSGFYHDDSIVFAPDVLPTKAPYVAIQNHSPFWCSPFFGKKYSDLPDKVQMLLIKKKNAWVCIMPTVDDTFKTVLRGCETGFEFVSYTNCDGLNDCTNQLAFVVGEGENVYELLHDTARFAADQLGNGLRLREERDYPELFEYFGWCSWDALQIRVSHKGLLQKANEFKAKGVPVHYAIIDDMWADVPNFHTLPKKYDRQTMFGCMHKSRMRSFDGAPDRFPKGMKAAIDDLKKTGIPEVGIWFPTTGYWKGFTEDGEIFEKYKSCLTAASGPNFAGKQPVYIVKPEVAPAFELFNEFGKRIRNWGCSFVKIDNQGFHHHYVNSYPIGKSARAIQAAIDGSVGANFKGAMINCMGMPSECMYNRPSSAISRCSDDFIPESRDWFSKNIQQCAYNGLQQGQFYVNDWDMWWTDDEQAAKNSLCRSISGGPIYVSDMIDRTRAEVLKPVFFDDGRLLRCDKSAVPTEDCLLSDPTKSGKVFKIFNRIGNAGVLAAFHIDKKNKPISGTVSAKDTGIEGPVAYYEFFTGEAGTLKAGETLDLTLQNNDDFRAYTFVPMNESGVTLFGRIDKYFGYKAITATASDTVTLYEGGKIGFYSAKKVRVYTEDGKELAVEKKGNLSYVECARDQKVLKFVVC